MGRFELVASRVARLAPSQQDALADLVEAALAQVDRAGAGVLSAEQLVELRRLMNELEELADDGEVEAVFDAFVRSADR